MLNGSFPLRLALKEDSAFEDVLADIPLFCVGLMSMGLITFIFLMKRVNSTALYLCIASLLLFISAIVDLGQLLTREQAENKQNVNQDVVSGFVIAREVGLGLSSGFLFLFVWRAVAECPGAEQPESVAWPIKAIVSGRPHSASWTRWGLLGALLKWFTLALVLVIPLMQIIWRLINTQRQYESVYIADSTLEVFASAIFVLKVILNVLISPATSWWPPFRSYIGLVLGLLITGALGVGNLISFAFSETVLGRFLRAISVYVLLLWNLLNIFHRRHISRSRFDDQEALTTPIKVEKPRDLTFKSTDTVELARFPQRPAESNVALDLTMPVDSQPPPLRISTASRFSAIVDRVESNEALAEISRTLSSRSVRKSSVTTTVPKRPKRPELRFDIITPTLPSTAEAPESSEPPTTGISLSYYTMNPGPSDTSAIRESSANLVTLPVLDRGDSPEPIDHASAHASLVVQPPSQITSVSSIDELMRQQNEFDRSIAKLKLLSADMEDSLTGVVAVLDNSSVTGEVALSVKTRSQSTRTDSLSPRSEFSLSVFPIPPLTSESVNEEQQSLKPNPRKLPVPPTTISNQVPSLISIPETPLEASATARMVSAGTQYDVTSFIGNLSETESQVTGNTFRASDNVIGDERKAEHGSPPDSDDRNGPQSSHLKPMLLPTVANRKITPLPSVLHIRSGSQSSARVGLRDSNTVLKPFLLGTSVTSVPPHLPSSTMVPLGSRRGSRSTRTLTHKSRISVPRMNITGVLDESSPETFERPRPPPVLRGLPDRPKA